VRSEPALQKGLEEIAQLKAGLDAVDVRPTSEGYKDLAIALDLHAALFSAEATLLSALHRRESRGAHNRSDFPDLDPGLQVNFLVKMDESGALNIAPKAVPPIPDSLQEWVSGGDEEFSAKGRLLE
jgi:succinate dehydrogenase / fumarate reductase, flavoprotein subunit